MSRWLNGASTKNRLAGPGDSSARTHRFVSTTSRTFPFLPPLPTNRIDFPQNLVVAQSSRGCPSTIALAQRRLEALGQQGVKKRLPLLRRKLPCKLNELCDCDRDREAGHRYSIALEAVPFNSTRADVQQRYA